MSALTTSPVPSSPSAASFHKLALVIDGLRSESLEKRVSSACLIGDISLGLGPERTRDELLPFLSDSIDDDDLVLLKLSESIPDITEKHLGGVEYLHLLLQPLELLLTVEEASVRAGER